MYEKRESIIKTRNGEKAGGRCTCRLHEEGKNAQTSPPRCLLDYPPLSISIFGQTPETTASDYNQKYVFFFFLFFLTNSYYENTSFFFFSFFFLFLLCDVVGLWTDDRGPWTVTELTCPFLLLCPKSQKFHVFFFFFFSLFFFYNCFFNIILEKILFKPKNNYRRKSGLSAQYKRKMDFGSFLGPIGSFFCLFIKKYICIIL